MRLPSAFNAQESEKLGDFTPIPAGTYLAHITKSELKSTKNGSGQFLQFTFTILEGEYVGKVVPVRLNIQNPSAVTMQIAQKTLATICECANVQMLEDTEELHGKPMYINVIVKKADANYPEQNDVKGYSPADGPPPAMPSAPKVPAVAAATKATPPWKRN